VGGILKVYKRNEDGSLTDVQTIQLEGSSVHPQQTSPLLHSTKASPGNQYIAVADKGTDKIWLFTIDEGNEQLVPHSQPFVKVQAGAGPRHMVWSENGAFLYVINELDKTINVIQHKAEDQSFASVQSISTLPEGYEETSYCADIHLHPNGQFLYGSNRGHNSIAMYSIDAENGMLTSLGQESTRGEYPRNFNISPNGNLLLVANQNTSNITSYSIQADGKLQFLDLDYEIETPVCIEY
ncbi:MAG: lactonase family protein, partial [Bacteroidota bacterium]